MTRPIVTPHGILADAYGRGDGDGDGDGDGGDVFLPRGDGDGDGGDVFLPCGDGGGPGCWRSPVGSVTGLRTCHVRSVTL